VIEKYAFVAAEYVDRVRAGAAGLTIAVMTALLGVSKSGYYKWLGRPPSGTWRRREELATKVKALFDSFGGVYGYRVSTPSCSVPVSMWAMSWSANSCEK